jgi:hypothetical protein
MEIRLLLETVSLVAVTIGAIVLIPILASLELARINSKWAKHRVRYN